MMERGGRARRSLMSGFNRRSRSSWPPSRRRGRERANDRAFTLLEVLLSIAIIALLATVLVGGSARMLNEQPVTSDDVFWTAVREARKAALKAEHEMRLRYDREKKRFVLIDGLAATGTGPDGQPIEEAPLKVFRMPPQVGPDFLVELLGATKGAHAILVGGMLLETHPLKYVTFYPDGTCTSFRAQFSNAGDSRILAIDPWTCAPVLAPVNPDAPKS